MCRETNDRWMDLRSVHLIWSDRRSNRLHSDGSDRRSNLRARRGLTLIELMISIAVTSIIVTTISVLASTVDQASQFNQGQTDAVQHARVVLDRVGRLVNEAYATETYPGVVVVDETVNAYRYPDTLVISAAPGPQQAHNPTSAESAIYRRSGGGSWQQVREGLPPARGLLASVLAANEAEPGVFYAANNKGLFRSADAGSTWEELPIPWPADTRLGRAHALVAVQE